MCETKRRKNPGEKVIKQDAKFCDENISFISSVKRS